MHATAGNARNQFFIVDLNFQYHVYRHARFTHGFRLRYRSRKTVKQKPVSTIRLRNTLFNKFDDDVVRHQRT